MLQSWQFVVLILSVLIFPAIGKWILGRLEITKNTSAIELERVERIGGDKQIRIHCELAHKRVDETLTRLETQICTTGKTVTCIDKKIVLLLRENGIDAEDIQT
jgi:hypothetical protein